MIITLFFYNSLFTVGSGNYFHDSVTTCNSDQSLLLFVPYLSALPAVLYTVAKKVSHMLRCFFT